MWKIPFFDISFDNEEIDAVNNIIRCGWLTQGEVTKEFEAKFANSLGIKHAIAVSNGTSALHLANLSLGIGVNDEVICPSLTFVASSNSVIYTGAKPVFLDIIGSDCLNISTKDIRSKITDKTKAILVVHYGGYPCDMDEIMSIANENGLSVVEDCAHALFSSYNNKYCGAIGDVGCFSFYSNKNMTTGEGGMVTTNNDDLANKIRLMRSHGITKSTLDRYKGHSFSYDVACLGYNYRIDELRAAIGIVQLGKLNVNNKKRQKLSNLYIQKLKSEDFITIPFKGFKGDSSRHIFPIILNDEIDRNEFMDFLKEEGIQTSIHYNPVHLFSFYKETFGYNKGILPVTEAVSKKLVTLPLYPAMSEEKVFYVCKVIGKFINNKRKLI